MSWKASAYVKELTTAPNGEKLTRSEKLLLLVMADYYSDDQQGAWPSANTLAKDAMLSRHRVWELIKSLARKKALEIEHRRFSDGAPDTNFYRLPGLAEGSTKKSLGSDIPVLGSTESRTRGSTRARTPYKEEPPIEPPEREKTRKQRASAPGTTGVDGDHTQATANAQSPSSRVGATKAKVVAPEKLQDFQALKEFLKQKRPIGVDWGKECKWAAELVNNGYEVADCKEYFEELEKRSKLDVISLSNVAQGIDLFIRRRDGEIQKTSRPQVVV